MAMWGSEEWCRRREEDEARRAKINDEQRERACGLDRLLRKADTDLETARLVEMARLLEPNAFKMREEGLQRVQEMRLSHRGNDPDFQSVIDSHDRVARLYIQWPIEQARAVIALVQSWESRP